MIADALVYCRTDLTPQVAVTLEGGSIPGSLDEAYRLMLARTKHDPLFGAAWKLGGATPSTQRTFGVDKPYFGILHRDEVIVDPASSSLFSDLFELKAEAEICLRISDTAEAAINRGSEYLAAVGPSDLFDQWCWGLEFPSSPITNLVDCGVESLIADRCAAGALVMGSPSAGLPTKSVQCLQLLSDGRLVAKGTSAELLAEPGEIARTFLVEATQHGFSPRAGQWIATGGITPCVAIDLGASLTLNVDGIDVLNVKVGQK